MLSKMIKSKPCDMEGKNGVTHLSWLPEHANMYQFCELIRKSILSFPCL